MSKKYTEDITEEMAKVIGSSRGFLPIWLKEDERKNGELALGNWQTDVMREWAEANFAFQNIGGIRASIPEGKVTLRNIWELSPFGNTLVTMDLTGKQIKEILENSVSGRFGRMQVSGLRVIFSSEKPKGNRIMNIIVDGGEIDEEKTYKVVTNNFLAKGGDNYETFKEGENIEDTGILLRDVEIDYIKKNSPISAKIEKRIVDIAQ